MTRKRHEIPTHLNVEDRAFYGLSVRQVMVLTVGFSGAYALWNQWPDLIVPARLGLAVACLLVATALALLRPGGRSFEEWAFVIVRYAAIPRTVVWRPAEPDPRSWLPVETPWEPLSPILAWKEEG